MFTFPCLLFCFLKPCDLKCLTRYPCFLQIRKNPVWHFFRQVDSAVIIKDIDPANIFGIDAGLVSNRADDIPRHNLMNVTDRYSIALRSLHGFLFLALTPAGFATFGKSICLLFAGRRPPFLYRFVF